jgi:hypothetical protein
MGGGETRQASLEVGLYLGSVLSKPVFEALQ